MSYKSTREVQTPLHSTPSAFWTSVFPYSDLPTGCVNLRGSGRYDDIIKDNIEGPVFVGDVELSVQYETPG
ncbi:hypothetical protein [Candidatus Hamiltonella endosymbiont of Tuberolachnus salignus]|uniref:hypothetical protein n=1 Tax=Candidatus Williamhamiltonella endosymbiont of Tuberolachnus salignus TaxID=3077954 RepID=UPI0015C548D4|nr:hypothetical protein [Candidatus Hamiltonella defensa]